MIQEAMWASEIAVLPNSEHYNSTIPPNYLINTCVSAYLLCVKVSGSCCILLDENLSWKEDLKLTENKITKNIGLIYKAKPYLNKDSLLASYFSYIHSYASVDFEFPLEVQQYGTIWSEVRKKKFNRLLILKLR